MRQAIEKHTDRAEDRPSDTSLGLVLFLWAEAASYSIIKGANAEH
jgi:hypothetical protein